MASPEDKMTDVSEVVIVTIGQPVSEDQTSVVEEEEKAVLVTAQITPQEGDDVLAVAPAEAEVEAEASNTDSLPKEETVFVKLSEEGDVDVDVFYPITCGDTKATLVWKKFVCPGINVKCVQFNDELISPKEFVCLAGKSTLKDWKRAIRLNGTMLRKIMDSGELDFYQHAKVCSNTCRSTKIDLVGAKVSIGGDQSTDSVPAPSSTTDMNGAAGLLRETAEEASEWVTTIGEDSVVFWRAVKEAGLLEEVVEDFQKELQEVLKGLQDRVSEPPLQVKDAVLLNNIVQNFGMPDLVKRVLASHKSQMDRYREQYTRSLAALEHQCDEHRKRAKELKSKSQHLNNVLMTLTPVPSTSPSKRPRLTRTVSGPAKVSPAPAQITLPLNQLTSLPLGKVLTVSGAPATANLGGYTLLTSALSGSELLADSSNLTVLSAALGREGVSGSAASTAFVKLLGPQYQLVTLPAAALQTVAAQQQVSTISVVDATSTTEESQEESQGDGNDEGGQPEQVEQQQ